MPIALGSCQFRKLHDCAAEFFRLLAEALEGVEFSVDLESDMAADPDYPEVELLSYALEDDFTIVKIGEDEIVAEIGCILLAEVSVNVSFSVHDGIDNDEVPMGNMDILRPVEFDGTSLLVTLRGDFSSDDWCIAGVELSNMSQTIDVGYVAPDLSGDVDDDALEPD